MTSRSTPHGPDRGRGAAAPCDGFTLVELLVVIAIISVLIGLVTVAGVRFIGQAREAATRTTIKKVDEAILERVSAVNRWHQRPQSRLQHDWYELRPWGWDWRPILTPFGGTPGYSEVEMVLSRKAVLRELLPINRSELEDAFWVWAQFDTDGYRYVFPPGSPNNRIGLSATERAAMTAFLDDIDGDSANNTPGGAAPGKPSALDRPGEVFLYALLNAPVFGGQRMAEDDFSPSELIDPDADGIPELGDGWGNPIHFYRWPTRLVNDRDPSDPDKWGDPTARTTLLPNAPIEASGAAGSDLKTDPDDPSGYLTAYPRIRTAFEAFAHDANTWHAPLLVSPGPDGRLGLQEPGVVDPIGATPRRRGDLAEVPWDASDPAVRQRALEELYDNITNHNDDGGL